MECNECTYFINQSATLERLFIPSGLLSPGYARTSTITLLKENMLTYIRNHIVIKDLCITAICLWKNVRDRVPCAYVYLICNCCASVRSAESLTISSLDYLV